MSIQFSEKEVSLLSKLGIWSEIQNLLEQKNSQSFSEKDYEKKVQELLDQAQKKLETEKEDMFFSHRESFGEEAKRRIMLGTWTSSAGYADAYYKKAQEIQEMVKVDFQKAFEACDLILTPTTPEFPFKIGEKTSDPLKMYLSDVFTCGINPAGIPGLNVPLGFLETLEEDKKLPSGLQILGPKLSEDKIYELAMQIEDIQKSDQSN